MKPYSQDTQTVISFAVWRADWEPYYEHSMDEDDLLSHPVPSTRHIDDRTIKTEFFHSEEEAVKYAKAYLVERGDDAWLAYVEIKKITLEVISKLK